jgi:hypothetical protein
MKAVFFLLLRIVCYPALAIVLAAGLALIFVSVNGQCPPISGEIGVTCVTKFSQLLADFGLLVGTFTLDKGFPIVLAVGGLVFLMRDARRRHG